MGRVSAFADPNIIETLTTSFVPVAADDWYQRRRTDATGKFFRDVYQQSSRRGAPSETKQGLYTFTADGQLLGFNNRGDSVERVRTLLLQSLERFQTDPAIKRRPGGILVPDHGPHDPKYSRKKPKGAAVINVYSRILESAGGEWQVGRCDFVGGSKAGRDHMWVTADEQREILPHPGLSQSTQTGPSWFLHRLVRFHLVDNTRGEPDFWPKDAIREAELVWTRQDLAQAPPADLPPEILQDAGPLELWQSEGKAHLQVDGDQPLDSRGLSVRIRGTLLRESRHGKFLQLKLVALGRHWGSSTYTRTGVRPGRQPIGFVFGYVPNPEPRDLVAPQGTKDWDQYFSRD